MSAVRDQMLLGPFYIDGWHNKNFLEDAEALVRESLLTREIGGGEQYTVYRYRPAEKRP